MTAPTHGFENADDGFHVAGIGSALVDLVVELEDDDLAKIGLVKGTMTLIDLDQANALRTEVEARSLKVVRHSGGSVANTMVGMASLGAKVAYLGKVGRDELAEFFVEDMARAGAVAFCGQTAARATGHCLVFVTPDGERTMATHLGAASTIAREDVVADVLSSSRTVYLEGYLWDLPQAKDAMKLAMELAQQAQRLVAFTLSDPFCVDRHRQEFLDLLRGPVDLVLANEAEAMSLLGVETLDEALQALSEMNVVAAITKGGDGSVVIDSGVVAEVDASPVAEVVDTTGAGDLYASGFLFGLSRQLDHEACAKLGSLCAAEVIAHLGARPLTSLSSIVARTSIVG